MPENTDVTKTEVPQETSLRDDIAAAVEEHTETPEAGTPPAGQGKAPEGEPPAKTPPEDVKTPPGPSDKKAAPEKDEKGRFKKAAPPPGTPEAKTEVKPEEKKAEESPGLPKSRAPGSWKPTAREKWTSLPIEIQQEVLRRERDIANGFNEIGEVKKFRDGFHQMLQPYQNIIAAEGNNPMKMINDLFATAQVLYHGSTAQKVNTVAGFIKHFGVDLKMLDDVLASGASAPDQGGNRGGGGGGMDAAAFIRQTIQQELAPILRGQGQATEAEVQSEIEAFANDPKNEWFEDVKDTMADLLEVAAKQGKTMDLSTAYNRAIMMHSEIADVVEDRRLREKAAQASAAAQQARKKAVSVTGAPAKEPAGSGDGSLRGDIVNAIESLT